MAKDELCSSIGGSQSFGRNISRPTPGNPRTTNKINAGKGDPVLKHRDLNSIQSKKRLELDLKHLPIPRGNSPYALAKRAEYEEKDLAKAEEYYKQAILQGERVESAIKDLASVMHQQGKTKDACEFLRKHRDQFASDFTKFENLLINLEKQVIPTGNCLNKYLKISGLTKNCTEKHIKRLFKNPARVVDISFLVEMVDTTQNRYAVVKFASHSAARKTLEGFHHWEKYKVEWLSVTGEVVGDANFPRHSKLEDQQRLLMPLFCYALFARDPENLSLTLPVDKSFHYQDSEDRLEKAEKIIESLIGNSLYQALCEDFEFRVSAEPFIPRLF